MFRITVAIPFLNAAPTLADAIQSVANQTFGEFECLLVDDGSSDGSLAIAESFARKDSRFRVVADGRNIGLPARLNQIAAMARCEWLARMDADDVMFPMRLERQWAYAQQHAVDIVGSDVVLMDISGNPLVLRSCTAAESKDSMVFLKVGGLVHPSLMIRREWLLTNPYSGAFPRAEDRELWCRTLKSVRIGIVPEPLLFYRLVGQVRRAAYLLSYESERKVLRAHGPALVGIGVTTVLWLRSLVKSWVFRTMCLAGREQFLAKPRRLACEADRARWSECYRVALARRSESNG